MAPVPSVRIVKTFPFKGGSRQWSNRYHFLGGTPADATHWHTLMDAITTAEKAVLSPEHTIVEAWGYAAGSDVPVANKVYSIAGTHTLVGIHAPGEVCAIVRYATAARTTKNHPIYLFNYYHSTDIGSTTGTQDLLLVGLKGAYSTYAGDWISGFSDGSNTYTRSSPNGAAATGSTVGEYLTHRDFPYTSSV